MIPTDLPRRSFVYRKLQAAGANFVEVNDAAVAQDFGDPAGEAARAPHLGLADLSPLPRLGFKGLGTAAWLAGQGVAVPDDSNRAQRQDDGSLAARLAPGEVLILADLDGTGALVGRLTEAWAAGERSDPPRGYPVPRQDSHAWFLVTGVHAAAMLAKLCAVDLRPARFADGRIAQTVVAELAAIVIRDDRSEVAAYHLLVGSAAAEYLWHHLTDAMADFAGRPIGWSAVRGLIPNPLD